VFPHYASLHAGYKLLGIIGRAGKPVSGIPAVIDEFPAGPALFPASDAEIPCAESAGNSLQDFEDAA
jgi:hypothetical protein